MCDDIGEGANDADDVEDDNGDDNDDYDNDIQPGYGTFHSFKSLLSVKILS